MLFNKKKYLKQQEEISRKIAEDIRQQQEIHKSMIELAESEVKLDAVIADIINNGTIEQKEMALKMLYIDSVSKI